MIKFRILILLLIFLVNAANATEKITKLIVFGDSYSDVGFDYNITKPFAKYLQAIPIVSAQFPTGVIPSLNGRPYFSGRFSNGKLIVEYLANFLGIKNTDYEQIASNGNFLDFAASGAGVAAAGQDFFPPGLLQQITKYNIYHNTNVVLGTDDSLQSNTMAIIFIGGDYFVSGKTNVSDLVAAEKTAIIDLQNDGIEKILVISSPNLSLLPYFAGSSLINLTMLNDDYNNELGQMIASFNDKDIMFFSSQDSDDLFSKLLYDPIAYGFITIKPCYSIDSNPSVVSNYINLYKNNSEQKIMLQLASFVSNNNPQANIVYTGHRCADGTTIPMQHVYLDATHPTAVVNCAMAKIIGGFLYNAGYDVSLGESKDLKFIINSCRIMVNGQYTSFEKNLS